MITFGQSVWLYRLGHLLAPWVYVALPCVESILWGDSFHW
jgi:hypothetical protein